MAFHTHQAKGPIAPSAGPPGDKVAGLKSFRPMNRAQEPRLRGGSFVAGALYAPAGAVQWASPP
jgi:hypothetical protein